MQTGLAQTAAPSYDPHPADFGQPFRAVAGKGAAVMLAFDSRASLDSRVIILHGLGCVML